MLLASGAGSRVGTKSGILCVCVCVWGGGGRGSSACRLVVGARTPRGGVCLENRPF